MIHSSEEVWALDDGRHIAHGFCTDLAGVHVLHAAGAILGYVLTELCLPSQTCYESYSTTEIPLSSALLLPGVKPGSASNLCQVMTGKAESTLLFGPQL